MPGGIEFICHDVFHKIITCSSEQWLYISKHGEMINKQGLIRSIIQKPDSVWKCIDRRKTKNMYKRAVLERPVGDTTVRVVVEYGRDRLLRERGEVVTAYSEAKPKSAREVMIWEK